jgi:hypothetical protein
MTRARTPEYKQNPQLNFRPGRELLGRLTVMATVQEISMTEQVQDLLLQATEAAFTENPELRTAYEAFEAAREALAQDKPE